MRFLGMISAMEAEARVVQEAISCIEDIGLQRVAIEIDSELTVRAIHGAPKYVLEVGHIEACKTQLMHRPDLSICHIRKQINRVTQLLARVPCDLDCYNIFSLFQICCYIVGDFIVLVFF